MTEGYVFHTYGPEKYLRQAVASAVSIRRHDRTRPLALYASENQLAALEREGLTDLFAVRSVLPEAHRSIVGFKHHLERFMPFDANLFVDADMVWCRDPDPLWLKLSSFDFTATGLERADFWFGGPKGLGIVGDYVLDRRRRTMANLGIRYLPRVQAGMIYASTSAAAERVCSKAREFLARRDETHFRSRLAEGRSEESCEWSLAAAMAYYEMPVFPWFQAQESPQLDFVEGLVEYDLEFRTVRCRYYTDHTVQSLRGIPSAGLRRFLTGLVSRLPGRGDHLDVTPYALHFGWLRHKQPYMEFANRTWKRLTQREHIASSALA
ncbi:MAG: hypothetical protein JJ976_04450 [Rhodothermales bacterium]|nr:hypothetical protein [Rhodothermales bacterium]